MDAQINRSGKIEKPDCRTERGSRGSVKEVRRDWMPGCLASLPAFLVAWEPESLRALEPGSLTNTIYGHPNPQAP